MDLIQILAGAGGVSSAYAFFLLGKACWRWFQAARKAGPQRVQDQIDEIREIVDRLAGQLEQRKPAPSRPDVAKGEVG